MTVKDMPYIKNLELSNVYLDRITEIYEYFKLICPEEIKRLCRKPQ
jgi:hypothetical protein